MIALKIAITVGHSRLKNGCYTSADGTKYGGCNEYIWCKKYSEQLEAALKQNGHKVDVIICPEKKFTSSSEEKPYKLNIINSGNYNLVIELHLNSSLQTANGTEVLYKTDSAKKYATEVQKQLSTVFRDRGIKNRTDLYILNGSKAPAILIETFFCTNKNDYMKAKGIKNRRNIAQLTAKGIQKALTNNTA